MNTLSLKERFQSSRFFSGEKAVDKPVTLNHRRIFILPTHRGLNFVILIALLLLIALIYNNNLVYLLAFLLASIFFITILHSYRSLAGLVIQKGQSKAVFAGEAAGFDIHIDNPTRFERHYLQITLEQPEPLSLKPQGKTCVTLYSTTGKRGWHMPTTVTVSSTYPLGLFRAWSPLRFHLKALVYPKPSSQKLPFPEAHSEQTLHGFGRKGADDFYGLKEYQPGDSIKYIHWKAFAKGQGLFSKHYSGDSSAEIQLDYTNVPGHTIEERLSLLCRWVIDAERAGIPYGLVLPGLKLPPNNGLAHTQKCLEALALF